jgi:hypothetical protein
MQEALRKDVERVFGVLQACFSIVSQPAQSWKKLNLHKVMKICVILHNMIVEDERESPEDFEFDHSPVPAIVPERSQSADFSAFVQNVLNIQDEVAHHQLRNNLIKHLWELKGCAHE